MKLVKLEESVLLEKEVTGAKNVGLSAEVIQKIKDGDYKGAYSDVLNQEEGQGASFIYVVYDSNESQKMKGELAKLGKTKGGVSGTVSIIGHTPGTPLKGFLKQASSSVKTGWFSGNIGLNFLGVQDSAGTVIVDGLFTIVPTTTDATPYSEKDVASIISKLKGGNIGITEIKEEKAPSKKQAFYNTYLNKIFPGQADAIKEFKQELMGLLIALEFKPNALVTFLSEYLKKHKMSKSGFITLNNTYAKGSLDDVDLQPSSELYPLFMSNLFVNTGVADAEAIIDAYKSIIYSSSWQGFNMNEMEILKKEKDPNVKLVYDKTDGSLEDDESKKNLADLIVFRKGRVGQEVESPAKIKETIAKIKSKNTSAPKAGAAAPGSKPAETAGNKISVSVDVPTNVSKQTSKKVDKIASDLAPDEVASLLATLKKQKKI
jgi:hypothetical protein